MRLLLKIRKYMHVYVYVYVHSYDWRVYMYVVMTGENALAFKDT